ncbi:DUF2939 domain-containing protein [Luteimonas sp. MC1828]|uniref:DUF2939 domain-containing protein n=1 Tax=Luteimonas sp. MC1828 TaxID=2799787 RepID=UPI0018F260A5|nr:DUF2939 domain-containing protein [Luteimonas sp. MC1828]MBJ7574070.1 DUF2939 domain-containing protein [Luteimonas sp. MC1828]
MAKTNSRWIILVCVVLAALLAWVASGPYRTIAAIRDAVKTEDAGALARQVDFPALRASLKLQLQDRIVREAGAGMQADPFGAFGLRIATGLAGGLVDAMVTPAGLGALMEGRKTWNRASGIAPPSRRDTTGQSEPLPDPRHRFESPSRFTATVAGADGNDVVFVLTRQGLQWKLSDIRLPE